MATSAALARTHDVHESGEHTQNCLVNVSESGESTNEHNRDVGEFGERRE